MDFATTYGRKFGVGFMLIIPLLIASLIIITNFNLNDPLNDTVVILWIFLFLNSLVVSISGYSLSSNFTKEVKRVQKKGLPITSMDGFEQMDKRIRNVFASAFSISITVFLSLVTFIVILYFKDIFDKQNLTDIRFMLLLVAFSLILIAIGISLLISLPDAPALKPGSLMKYFVPHNIPTQLDNFLADAIFPFLDPITRSRWDEFSEFLSQNIAKSFLPQEDPKTRLEIVREKVLLFAYLSKSIPETITRIRTNKELAELFSSPEAVERLMAGELSGITWETLRDIIKHVKKEAPEIFQVVDRLIVQLTENMQMFKEENLYVTITAPSNVSGNRNPFRILVFLLNMDPDFQNQKRPLTIKMIPNAQNNYPDTYEILLDEAEFNITQQTNLSLFDDKEDIVGLLSRILQVGDAVWYQVYRRNLGYHIFNIRILEEGKGVIDGHSIAIKLERDVNYFISQYGGKISALGGAVLPLVGLLGLQLKF